MRSSSRHPMVVLLALLALAWSTLPAPAAAQVPAGTFSQDRYGTAAVAALMAFPDGADVAVLASGETFADALAAAPLAAAYDAPILLAGRDHLPDSTLAALDQLGVADVLVMGGSAAIGDAVADLLRPDRQVSRVAGADRYATAAQAARDAFPDGAAVAVLASGEAFPDALAAAPLAASYDAPILLTGRDQLPAVTRQALDDLGVADVLVMGGSAAVSDAVTNPLHVDFQVSRVAGADRYATAAQAARDAVPDGADVAVMASGTAFPDALAAAPLAAAQQAPIVLTDPNVLETVTLQALADLGVQTILVMGGSAAISDALVDNLRLEFDVLRVSAEQRQVDVFFANPDLGDPCGQVFPRPRSVAAAAPLRPALEALLAGPTAAEQAAGYGGWFSAATADALVSVSVVDGTAHVDLTDLRAIIPNASTSCGSAGLLAQLDRTATQFATVDRARYSILGSEATFYEWLQLDPPG